MALERITKNNYALHPPQFPVYAYWYNVLIDLINGMTSDSGASMNIDTINEMTSGSGVTVDGVLLKDGQIAAANTTTALGANATPVVRTNNPIVGANAPNVNIDALDAAIGADNTPVARTNNPTVANTTLNAKVQALDNCIGTDGDITPTTRTVGQIVVNSTVNAKFEVVDQVIGFDAQMSGTGKNVSKTLTIYQNMDALDTYKSVQTIKKTIGGVGVASCDFNFATAGDQNEQVIDLGAIVPALARIIDCFTVTNTAFTGAVSLSTEVGTTSSGHELLGAVDIIAANTINAMATDHAYTIAPVIAAGHVYVASTPGANWSLVTAGKMSVYITFINVTNI